MYTVNPLSMVPNDFLNTLVHSRMKNPGTSSFSQIFYQLRTVTPDCASTTRNFSRFLFLRHSSRLQLVKPHKCPYKTAHQVNDRELD